MDQVASAAATIIIALLVVGLGKLIFAILTGLFSARLSYKWHWLAPLMTALISGGLFALLRPLVIDKPLNFFVFVGLCIAVSLLVSAGTGLALGAIEIVKTVVALSPRDRGRALAAAGSHDAPDLEATMPTTVATRPLRIWSVAGTKFWDALGGARVRSALGSELEAAGVSPDTIAMAVAGREDTRDPPSIVWALRFGDQLAATLPPPATALAMDVMKVDANQGENWYDATIGDKTVLVGNHQMVQQDGHHRGKPYLYLGATAIYSVIADDEPWAAEVIRQLPASADR